MAKIKIEIDTDSGDRELVHPQPARASRLAGSYVGVVSTISLKGTNLENSLTSGISAIDPAIQIRPPIRDKNDYKHGNTNAIQNWIRTLSTNCDLIIAVGGVMAYEAAVSAPSSKPFLSVLGAIPKKPYPTLFRGGVSLAILDCYKKAAQALTQAPFGLQFGQICFLYNSNNDFSDDPTTAFIDSELDYWANNVSTNVKTAGPNAQGTNDPGTFAPAFQALAAQTAPQIKGIVVSADPFFRIKERT
jgi:hypothetical protein